MKQAISGSFPRLRARPCTAVAVGAALWLVLTAATAPAQAQSLATLDSFIRRPKDGALNIVLEFSRPVRASAHDQLLEKGYFYVDFFGVAGPADQADWPTTTAGIRHVRRLYYPETQVLRVILYPQQGAVPRISFAGSTKLFGITAMQTRLRPLTAAAGRKAGGSKKLLILDPGHGGRSSGAQTSRRVGGRHYEENEIVLQIARRMLPLIQAHPNLDVRMTRDSDSYVSLEERIAISERAEGDLFLSIHLNATDSRSKNARGFEVYYLSDGTRATHRSLENLENDQGIEIDERLSGGGSLRTILADLANTQLRERRQESFDVCRMIDSVFRVGRSFGGHSRGVKSAGFRVLMNFSMPAVLVECGFIDNPSDAALLVRPEVQDEIAALLFNAVNLYFARTDPEFQGYQAPVR